MKAADELAKHVGVKPACAALEVSRSTLYRRRGPSTGQQQPRPTPARALSETQRGEVFDTLCSERFVDRSPAEVVATLLDEEVYLCSERTMYRVLASEVPVQERRAQRTHPEYKKPELMATAPNQVWSWDITRLLGPKKWSYYYLYVIMDIYSRYVVGWMVADRENSALAGRLIQQSCLKHGVQPRLLTLHSDRGAPMTSQCTAQLLADLGVTRSLSRPQVSDDNPFSEAQFKTLKYHPSFPGRFGDQGQAKTFCRSFFRVQCGRSASLSTRPTDRRKNSVSPTRRTSTSHTPCAVAPLLMSGGPHTRSPLRPGLQFARTEFMPLSAT